MGEDWPDKHGDGAILVDPDGSEHFDEGAAIAAMLHEGRMLLVHDARAPDGSTTIGLSVMCSDLFAWGCADSEPLPYDQVEPLYRAWRDDPSWGVERWLFRRRDMQPQMPVVRLMEEDGAWDAEMDNLPENPDRKLYASREGK